MTPVRASLLGLPLLVLLAACSVSTEPSYDAEEIADSVVAEQEKVTPDLEVGDGTCEEDVELEVGATIACEITIDGVTAPYTVEVKELRDETANYRFRPAEAIVSTVKVEEMILAEIVEQGIEGATVDCGEAAVIVEEAGNTFPCTAVVGGRAQEGTVTVKDLDGNVSFAF